MVRGAKSVLVQYHIPVILKWIDILIINLETEKTLDFLTNMPTKCFNADFISLLGHAIVFISSLKPIGPIKKLS